MYERALGELRGARKTGHWMWFIFPQLAGLGSSPTARRYAIADLSQARAYLAHPVLGPRLRECCAALLDAPAGASAQQILGEIDALKLRSCATLFLRAGGAAGPGDIFAAVLDRFDGGVADAVTDRLLTENG